MIFEKPNRDTNTNESQTMEALVPMVDLFAVLAVMFMIYSNQQIAETKLQSAKEIKDLVAKIEKEKDEKKARREFLAKKAVKSLQEVKRERDQKAKDLIVQFTKMMAAQQSQADEDYQQLVAKIEYEHEEELEKEVVSLQEEKRQEVENEKQQLKKDLKNKKKQLEAEKTKALKMAKVEYDKKVVSRVAELAEDKKQALAEARQQRAAALKEQKKQLEQRQQQAKAAALAKQKAKIEQQAASELAKARQQHAKEKAAAEAAAKAEKRQALADAAKQKQAELAAKQAAGEADKRQALADAAKQKQAELAAKQAAGEADKRQALADAAKQKQAELAAKDAAAEADKQQALADAAKQKQAELAAKDAAAEADKQQALADAAKQKQAELAAKQAAAEADKQQALADAAKKKQAELAAKDAAAKADKQQALADAAKAHGDDLAKQKAAADKDKEAELGKQKALMDDMGKKLGNMAKAADAKNKIVEQLKTNFKDFDGDAVEIDKKTGKVKLHFENSYFVRGEYQLSEDMKEFLRIMIPKYAKSIYGNRSAAKLVQSLKISGMTSPVYFGNYVDINDVSGRWERARSFNMALSNKRAIALYNFIFDEKEMGDYKYRNRMKADMGIAALGYQKAKPVPAELVGKPADCIEYDCKKEQATILQFKLHVGEQERVF